MIHRFICRGMISIAIGIGNVVVVVVVESLRCRTKDVEVGCQGITMVNVGMVVGVGVVADV